MLDSQPQNDARGVGFFAGARPDTRAQRFSHICHTPRHRALTLHTAHKTYTENTQRSVKQRCLAARTAASSHEQRATGTARLLSQIVQKATCCAVCVCVCVCMWLAPDAAQSRTSKTKMPRDARHDSSRKSNVRVGRECVRGGVHFVSRTAQLHHTHALVLVFLASVICASLVEVVRYGNRAI